MQHERPSPAARVGNAPERSLPEPERGLAHVPNAGPARELAATQKKTLAVLDGTRATCLPNGKVLLEISADVQGISGDAEIIVNGDVVDRFSTDPAERTVSAAAFLPETAAGQNLYVAVRIANVMSRVRQVMAAPENVDSPELALRLVRQNPSVLADRNICQLLWKSGKLAEHLRERPADYAAIADQMAKGDPDVLVATLESDPFMGKYVAPAYFQQYAAKLLPLVFRDRNAAIETISRAPDQNDSAAFEALRISGELTPDLADRLYKKQNFPTAFLGLLFSLFPQFHIWENAIRGGKRPGLETLVGFCDKSACEILTCLAGDVGAIQKLFNKNGADERSLCEIISDLRNVVDDEQCSEWTMLASENGWTAALNLLHSSTSFTDRKGYIKCDMIKRICTGHNAIPDEWLSKKCYINFCDRNVEVVREFMKFGYRHCATHVASQMDKEYADGQEAHRLVGLI